MSFLGQTLAQIGILGGGQVAFSQRSKDHPEEDGRGTHHGSDLPDA